MAAITQDNAVISWGTGSTGAADVPPDLSETTAIAAGLNHTLALLPDGTVRKWGTYYAEGVPEGLAGVAAIDASDNYSMALMSDGTVNVWGDGERLQPPPGLNHVVAIAAGREHIVALKSDGTLVGWGRNRHDCSGIRLYGGLPGSDVPSERQAHPSRSGNHSEQDAESGTAHRD